MSIQILKIGLADQDCRLDVFLAHKLSPSPSRSVTKKMIEHGFVKVNERLVKAHHKLQEGDDVFIDVPENFLTPKYAEPENIPLDIVFEDQWLLVINKPKGLMVHPSPGKYSNTLVNALKFHKINLSTINDDTRPGIVHRLDKETSGLILIAKDNITHTKLAKLFARREVKKKYVALVEGEIEFDEGLINQPIGRHAHQRDKMTVVDDEKKGKKSETIYRVIKRYQKTTLVGLYPKTGRTHQLRVHMKYLGHPILGDEKYGKKRSFPRLALHAQEIGFVHPSTKEFVQFSLPIPKEFLQKVSLDIE